MENTAQSFNDLSNFNWEANPNETDFFGIKTEQYQEQVQEDKKREPKVEENEELPKEQQEDTEKSPIFESFASEEEEPTKESKKSPGRPAKVEEQQVDYIEQFNSFKGYGLFRNVDLGEDIEDLDEDTFKDLLEQDFEEEVSTRIEQWASQELDEDAQAFIKFKKNGGRTSDFFKAYDNSSISLKGNIEDESFQDKVIRTQLAEEGWDKEEIEDRIEYLKTIDKKQTTAEKYYNKIQTKAQKEADRLLKQQEDFKRQQEASRNEFRNTVKETLTTTQEVKGFKITPKDRTNLFNFITKEDQEVNGRKVTGFQKAISEAVQDPESMVLLAKLLASGFDMSDLEKKASIKATNKIKENLESRKGLRPTTSRGSQLSGGKSLADLFD